MAAYFITSAAAAVFSWWCWPTGLICGAFIAVELGKKVRGIHYPLLVAAAYSVFWSFRWALPNPFDSGHAGHLVGENGRAGPGDPDYAFSLEPDPFGGHRPDRGALPHHSDGASKRQVIELDITKLPEAAPPEPKKALKGLHFNDWVENNYIFNLLLGGGLVVYNIFYFAKGGSLTINATNLIFMTLGLLLTPTPIQYVKRCIEGAGTAAASSCSFLCTPASRGMMLTTGLAQVIAGWFVAISTVRTLPLWSFISAGNHQHVHSLRRQPVERAGPHHDAGGHGYGREHPAGCQ
jgi:short-chain fatty acids transporter